ncbi:MAG: glycosyltransferase family 4 protein, partial [Cyanobacteria bacterium J06621_8]
MKITLIIHGLSSGGAERVMSVLANYWAAKGWQINILTFVDEAPFYRLDSKINYIPLGIAKNSTNLATAIINNWQSIQKLRRAITKSDPNLVISFMTNVNVTTLLATRGLNIPVVISERNDPNKLPASKVWISLRSLTYGLASAIVVQTNRAFNYFRPQLQSKMAIIANPVIIQTEPSSYNPESSNQLSIVAMGRLEHQKGFDLLLEAFAHLKDDYPEWTLSILGEGTLREELESQRSRLKLGDRVYFPGRVENPAQLLKQADIFVMSSRFEGFPNALCEAMACGLPVISTDCPNGPREI